MDPGFISRCVRLQVHAPSTRFFYFFINASIYAVFIEYLGVREGALTVTATTVLLSLAPDRKVWLKIYFLHQNKHNQATFNLES